MSRAPGDVGWGEWHLMQRDPARRAYRAKSRNVRYSQRIARLGKKADSPEVGYRGGGHALKTRRPGRTH